MTAQPVIIERTYPVPVEKLWQALTDKDQMKQWYFDLSAFKPEKGFEFSFTGEGVKGEKYVHRCTVTEVVPLKKLQCSWAYEGYPGHSLVTFELFEEGENTRLRLTHEGLESFPTDNGDFAKQNFVDGWTYITGTALKNYLDNPHAEN